MKSLLMLGSALVIAALNPVRPNFSGRWHLINPAISGSAQDFSIAQDSAEVRITSPGDGKSVSVYNLNGSESHNGKETGRVTWEGARMGITTTSGKYSSTMYYSIAPDSTLVIETTTPPPMGSGSLIRLIYKKI